MIKLVPAICPCCGGQLELDDNMKRTECQYCKNTIIVDEAIEKFKTDSKGKIKVSGIKDLDQYLEEAEKYLKIKKFQEANDTCNIVLQMDAFNDDASIIKVLAMMNLAYNIDNLEESLENGTNDSWIYLYAFKNVYDNLQKVIDANDSKKYVDKKLGKENIDKCNHLLELLDTIEDPSDPDVVTKRVNDILDKYKEFSNNTSSSMVYGTLMKLLRFESYGRFRYTWKSNATIRFEIEKDGSSLRPFFLYDKFNDNDETEPGKRGAPKDTFTTISNIYGILKENYEDMCKRYEVGKNLKEKANNFINDSNFLTKPKKIKYLCNALDIAGYTNDFQFSLINDYTIQGTIKRGKETLYADNLLSLEEIEKLIDNYK